MKKNLIIATCIVMASVGLIACGGDEESTSTEVPIVTEAETPAPAATEAPAATPEPEVPAAPAATEAPAATPEPEVPAATEAPATTTAAATTTTTAAAATTTTTAAAAPSFGNITVDCLNRALRVNAEVNKGSSDIRRVVIKRANEYNADLETTMTFLGPDTGRGNQWSAVRVSGVVDRITIVATDSAQRSASIVKSFDLPC